MIYLDNKTEGQQVWIPRNDLDFIPQKPTDLEGKKVTIDRDLTYVYPSSGFIGMSSVTINAEAYAQSNYDDGFDDGFLDGMSSGYTDGYASGYTSGSTDGFNSGYTSGQTDGFQSGYTSGETHQKSLLVSTALTENGTYTREDGWNEVEVSVDTGSTYESGYTSGYTDGYESGYTSGNTDGYDSGYTSGYTDGYDSGHTDGENAIIDTFTAMSVTENGQYGSSAHPLSSITVNVPQTGVSIPLSSITINSNTAITVNDVAYTGITVNVPLVYFDDYIHTTPLHSVNNLDYLIDTNIIPTTGTTMRVKGMNMGIWNGDTIAGDDERPYPTFRGFWTNNNIYFDWNSRRIYNSWTGNTSTTGNTIDVTFGNYYIYDNVAEEMIVTGSTIDDWTFNRSIKVDVGSWWLKEFEIWDGETKVFDGVAAHNSNGEIGLYDRISQKMYTNRNIDIVYENVTPVIEPNKSFTATSNGDYTITPLSFQLVVNEYIKSITFDASQYPEDGYFDLGRIYYNDNRDYYIDILFEDGEIGYSDSHWPSGGDFRCYKSFTGDTIMKIEFEYWSFYDEDVEWVGYETGFTYDAMSAVTLTVDVPQFIGNVKYVEYIETDGTSIGWDTGLKVGSENSSFNVELDVMPLSGNPTSDGFYTFMSDVNSSEQQNVLARTFGGGYYINDCQFLLGNRNVRSGLSFSQRYDMVYNYASQSGSIEVNNVEFLQEQGISLQSINTVRTIFINGYRNKSSETDFQRSPIARYYKVKITIDGVEHVFNPCLDSNDVPCFFDEYNREYIYHIGTGNTPTAGPVLPSPDYVSGYTDGYNSGYTSGYTSGHTSGYTDGQNNIIGTFSAYTATTNGQYGSSAHPLSAITVNVPTGSSVTLGEGSFSANGTYSASTDNLDGYSAITINVPTGGSVNIETGKTVSYDTNGIYTIQPMSSYTEYEKTQTMMDEDIFYFTAHTYPSSGVFSLAKVVDRNGGGYAEVLYQNGHITGTSYFPLYSCNIYAFSDVRLQVFPSSEFDCYVEELSGYSMVYDAMSSVTVNVNVPQQGDSSFIEYIEGPSARVLTVPKTTTTIRDGAFYNQTYFTGLTLPNSLTGIGASSFYGCSALSINNLTIPSGVTSIGYQAFYGCSGLTGSVKLSNKNDETNISNNAFQKCSSITGITLTGYTNFGNDVFNGCSNFKTITNQHYVKAIGATCFVGTDITGRIGFSNVTSIGNGAFYGLTKMTSFAVGDLIETIPTNLCNGCTALTAANIGSGVTQINSNAFANCTSLEELYFAGTTPPNVANANAFSNIASVGYLYHKAGTDYTDFKNTYLPSGWFDMPTL